MIIAIFFKLNLDFVNSKNNVVYNILHITTTKNENVHNIVRNLQIKL